MAKVILASSSRYRRELLARLGIEFDCKAPDVDETTRAGESSTEKARRLAAAKATVVAAAAPSRVVIGSDQTLECEGQILDKPGSVEALAQGLRLLSGRTFRLNTAVCLALHSGGKLVESVHSYEGAMRQLTERQIGRCASREPAIDCAGGMKIEGLGICLLRSLRGDDPTGVIGLPLVYVARALEKLGIPIP